MISLNACNTTKSLTDDFKLWGQPICLNDEEKKVVTDKNLNYYIKHNEMLDIKSCKDLKN
jgi:hypothetical protein